MRKISLNDGRRLFGNDLKGYAEARPDYPDALYEQLITWCGLRPRTSVFEIGPGTGLATRRLLSLGASPLRAIEPDPRLAAFLRETIGTRSLEIEQASFEEAMLPQAAFDLGLAATSFHWMEQTSALAKVYWSLTPGGWWAMWWNYFGSEEPDEFELLYFVASRAAAPSMASPLTRLTTRVARGLANNGRARAASIDSSR